MKSPEILEAKSGGKEKEAVTSVHTEAAQEDFFKKHKEFLEHYMGDSSVEILEAPPNLPTPFGGVDLEHGKMYVKPSFFTGKGYSEDKAMVCALHEYEHIKELFELLSRKSGEKVWKAHQTEVKGKLRLHILDNCVDDIKMNRSVVKRAPSLKGTKDNLYEEDLFPEDDMTKMPKHLQFAQAILRKKSLPNRTTIIAPEVQTEIDRLEGIKNSAGVSIIDYATAPETPMEMRLRLQKEYLREPYEKFFEEDVEERKDKENSENKDGESGYEDEQNKNGGGRAEGDENKDKKGEKKKEKGDGGKNKKRAKGEKTEKNPEDYFKKEYEEWEKNNPELLPMKDIEKAVEDFLKAKKKEKTTDEMMEEAYAKAEGVTVEELREYRSFWREVEDIENPETNEKVVEELREIFRKIITERKKKVLASKLPVSEGEILAYPAEAAAQIKAGVQEPEVWQTLEKKDKLKELYGEFDVTIVCDRSSSMKGEKAEEQRKSAALLLEALKEFADLIDEERIDLEYDLNVRTECWSFGDDKQVEMLKPLGREMTEKQRVSIYKTLADTPGDSTKDFTALEKIFEGVSDEDWEKIKNGVLRKIIIVLSDGKSDDASGVRKVLNKFRENDVVVIGIGITKGGKEIKHTYAPDGLVCEEASNLASTVGTLLEKYLGELNGKK